MGATLTVGVLGAGGYVGSRLIGLGPLESAVRLIPIVRSPKALARLRGSSAECRVIDTGDAAALSRAVADCDAVVNLTSGDLASIAQETRHFYQACQRAGVRRFIHLSSAVVYGRARVPHLPDDAPPRDHRWNLYARQKAQAEAFLAGRLPPGPPVVTVLRPGLVWGPASVYVVMAARQLACGRAVLANHGQGICNLIYVDNLARCLLAVAQHPAASGGFYHVADLETPTWREFYTGLATALGYPSTTVHCLGVGAFRPSLASVVEWGLNRAPLFRLQKWLLRRLGPEVKSWIKTRLQRALGDAGAPPLAKGEERPVTQPRFTREQWELQHTRHRLPTEKFLRDFGPLTFVPYRQALEQTAVWLRFAGFAPAPALDLDGAVGLADPAPASVTPSREVRPRCP